MNRFANSTTQDIKSAIQPIYWQLLAALQLPTFVWVGMVMLAATGICYSLTLHTRAELRVATSEHQQIANEVRELEFANARLARQLEAVEKDPRTIETLAREAGMVAADESVLFIKDRAQAVRRVAK